MNRSKLFFPLVLALLATLAFGSLTADRTPRTNDERVTSLAQQIRCPTCAGLSAAESEAPLAQSTREEIARRVAAGETDKQIKNFFVSRYGDTALLSPPRKGFSGAVWWLPMLAGLLAIAGVVYAVRRWKSREVPESSDGEVDVDAETSSIVDDGNGPSLGDPIADDLVHEPSTADSIPASSVSQSAVRDAVEVVSATPKKPLSRKMIWIIAVVTFVAIGGGVLAVTVADRQAGDSTTGTIAQDTNSMLRQAQSLTSQGKALDAVKTYDKVLKVDPDNVTALAYRGWLVRLAGLPDEGLKSIDRAIALDPKYPDPHFFRGFILLRDRSDPAGAIPEFEAFLANNPPQELVSLVEQALADAKAQLAAK